MMRRLALLTAAVVIAGGVAVAQGDAQAAGVCNVAWTTNQWAGGFTADVKVTNNGPAVSSWALSWAFDGGQRVTSGWNATVTQAGTQVTAASLPWNGALASGATTGFGFQGAGEGGVPHQFALNGISCNEESPGEPQGDDGTFENGGWPAAYPDCQGAGAITVDHTVAHSGRSSLRVDGAAGYCNHVFARNTSLLQSVTGNVWYVRYWTRHTTPLPAAHVTTVAMSDSADGGKDLRFGGQNGALQFNRQSDDATLPEQSPAGVALSAPLPVNTWNCVEMRVDGTDGTIRTWLNGTAIAGLTEDGVATHDIDGQWLNRTWRPRLTDLRLGWESYGSGADTLWFDDVVVAGERTGC